MTKIKYFFFDMDGVLIDSMEYHISAWVNAFKKHGLNATHEEILSMAGMSSVDTVKIIAERNSTPVTDELTKKLIKEKLICFKKIFEPKPYPKIIDYLMRLKKLGGKLCLVSGARKEIVEQIVNTEFNNIFDIVISAEDTEHGKPSPEPYLKALELIGGEKEESVIIEDALSGIKSANSANIPVYTLTTSFDRERLKNSTKIFETHKELFEELYKNSQ